MNSIKSNPEEDLRTADTIEITTIDDYTKEGHNHL